MSTIFLHASRLHQHIDARMHFALNAYIFHKNLTKAPTSCDMLCDMLRRV